MTFYLAEGVKRFQNTDVLLIKKGGFTTILMEGGIFNLTELIYMRYITDDHMIYMSYKLYDAYENRRITLKNNQDFPIFELYEWLRKHLVPNDTNGVHKEGGHKKDK